MSDELCDLKAHFSALLISDLIHLCNFVFCNPLYLSYIIFFSPYLLKFVSFLAPLFLTTLLFSIAFLTGISIPANPPSGKDFGDHGFQATDDLGIYEILFGASLLIEEIENPPEEKLEENVESGWGQKWPSFSERRGVFEAKMIDQKNLIPMSQMRNPCSGMAERRLENFLKILDQFEKMSTATAAAKKKIVPKIDNAALEGVHCYATTESTGGNRQTPPPPVKSDSESVASNNDDSSQQVHKDRSLGSWCHSKSGSSEPMRKEKEWKRTLACKLFEERHNVDGGEGMDSLWEAYERHSNNSVGSKSMGEKKKLSKKTSEIEFLDDDVVDGQLCCLQAVKLSAGRMNLSMGKTNLVKISKAIKGFGWLHHVNKHSKKVHNNGDR